MSVPAIVEAIPWLLAHIAADTSLAEEAPHELGCVLTHRLKRAADAKHQLVMAYVDVLGELRAANRRLVEFRPRRGRSLNQWASLMEQLAAQEPTLRALLAEYATEPGFDPAWTLPYITRPGVTVSARPPRPRTPNEVPTTTKGVQGGTTGPASVHPDGLPALSARATLTGDGLVRA